MKTCLRLYHHTLFPTSSGEGKGKGARNDGGEDEKPNKKRKKGAKGKEGEEAPRRINVELT